MLQVYGFFLSSPTNKVCYTANCLNIPYEFRPVDLKSGEHRKPEYLKINSFGKVPAIDDAGFKLSESNAIIRYLADKQDSPLYPKDLQARAIVDRWLEFSAQHVAQATSKIMWNTYFYKMTSIPKDERSLEDGRNFINQYLPMIEQQLNAEPYIAGKNITIADISLLSALDVCELAKVDLTPYPKLVAWRNKLISEPFYQKCHKSFTENFNKTLGHLFN